LQYRFSIGKYIHFIKAYGVITGHKLYNQLKSGDLESISLPNILYPIKLRPNTSDLHVFHQVFVRKEYNFKQNTTPNIIIDAGSNIGLYAIWMKNKYPNSAIICIEPDPENFAILKENLAAYSNIHFEQKGLWNKNTKLHVWDKYNEGKWAIVVEEKPDGNIDAISITSLLEKYKYDTIDILKIDIETSEKQLFSSNYESWLPLCKRIVIEFHDRILPGCSQSFFTAIDSLKLKYKLSRSGENNIVDIVS
jgi:FkbM family methyltransferase